VRILRIISCINPTSGGTVEALKQSSLALQAKGHTIHIVSLDNPNQAFLSSFPFMVHPLGPCFGKYSYTPRLSKWLEKHLRTYDSVIIEGIWQFHSFAAAKACKLQSVPYLLFPHGMLDPWFKHQYPLKHLKKSLYWRLFEHTVLKNAHAVCFTTEIEMQAAYNSFLPYACNPVVVPIGTHVPQSDFSSYIRSFHQQINHYPNERILFYLGRIHLKKGVDLILKALASINQANPKALKGIHFVIAGPVEDSGYKIFLETLIQKIAPTALRVTVLEPLLGDLKWGALQGSDAFILPSHQENFGMSVAEALGCNIPVLISNKVNSHPWIQQMQAGIVCEPTAASVQSMIKDWISWDAKKIQQMKANAYNCYMQFFNMQTTIHSLESLLNELHCPSNP
jgi:glycosyltransferase involved in cell wall biosynthesis